MLMSRTASCQHICPVLLERVRYVQCYEHGSSSYRVGTHRVPEHSDLRLRSHLASSIEEILSTSHSPPLGGSPHRLSSPFEVPQVYGCVLALALDDELQRSGLAKTPFLLFTPKFLPPMTRYVMTPGGSRQWLLPSRCSFK